MSTPSMASPTPSPAPARSATPWRRVSHAVVVAGLRLLSVVAGLAYVKYYTNALSVEQVGSFFYLGTMSYLLNALVFVPVDSYMQARLSRCEGLPAVALGRLVTVTLIAGLGACGLLGIPFIMAGQLVVNDLPLLYGLAALLYLCSSIRNLLNIRGQASFAASMVVLEACGRLLAFVAVCHWVAPSARTLLASSIVALATELVILVLQARRSLPFTDDRAPLDPPGQIIRTAGALSGSAASNTVQLQAYRLLFPAAGYAPTSAALGVTSNIGAVAMSACAQVFSQLFLPRLYQSGGSLIGRYVGWSLGMAGAVLVIGMSLSDMLVRHLTQAAYTPYAAAIGVGIIVEAGNLVIGAYGVYLTLHGKAGMLFRFQFAGAILSLGGCLVLLNLAPDSPLLVGAVVAASQLLITPALGFYVHRLQRQTL